MKPAQFLLDVLWRMDDCAIMMPRDYAPSSGVVHRLHSSSRRPIIHHEDELITRHLAGKMTLVQRMRRANPARPKVKQKAEANRAEHAEQTGTDIFPCAT